MQYDRFSYYQMVWDNSGATLGYMDTTETLGDRVRRLREEMGWTQGDVAEKLASIGIAIGEGQVGHVEKNRRQPSLDLLGGLARVFDTSTDYLLGVTSNQLSSADMEEELAAGGIGGHFERVMVRLSPLRREQVVEYANYLALVDQVSGEQVSNLRALQAVLSVLERSVALETMDRFWALLAADFPSLAGVLRAPVSIEQKRVHEG